MRFKIIADEDVDFRIVTALKNKENEKDISVIFLRYESKDLNSIAESLIKVLNKYGSSLYGKFVVITAKKIRIRDV